MRLFHTADWHLGHSLHGLGRDYEHRQFLDWLLRQLEQRAVDALLVCGDVFDSANPPASAQQLFYSFIAEARRRCPRLEMVIIGGNHDSPARLEAPAALLHALGVRVVGTLPRDAAPEHLLLPLHDAHGEIAAWCAALPFLRQADLGPSAAEADLAQAVRSVYQPVLEHAEARCRDGEALLATGHCYMVGGQISELSERKILGGNQHALPTEIFSPAVSYAALGHLHRPQAVGGQERIRYSGAPLALALDEAAYPHQIVQVDLEPGQPARVEALRVPAALEILRLPLAGPQALDSVLDQLAALRLEDLPLHRQPLLEVRVELERPRPGLRQEVEQALAGKPLRLLKLSSHYRGGGAALADDHPTAQLQDLQPEEVFRRRYAQQYGDAAPPSAALLAAFHELLQHVQEHS